MEDGRGVGCVVDGGFVELPNNTVYVEMKNESNV
jgi:hypothetical protein